MRRRLACLSLLICLPAMAQIYKYTDANGNTAYSNQPPDGTRAESVELKPLNSIPTPPAPAASSPSAAAQPAPPAAAETFTYQELALTGLPEEGAIRANDGTFSIGVKIVPKLQPGHRLQLLVDGTPYGQPTNVPQLQVVNLDRGEHRFAVLVHDVRRVIQQSPTVTLTVLRAAAGRP
ncbi:DUF4124 domain-containing protein [Pseudomonas sp. DTU_2021_1001937_2_SI_NGA_ILE_001]|uniref:DUF4124 domain-containing protein n=1 Tax=Pseudomonas sp. DTU_2021_1001937_2_SI_NGA_ILE_001 TaxID=3077589 RepID=UPI0028FC0B35|nr:DUF4124 domain-containing protein [Pseudomonas sp. DTU_2021_1001937_2_SI_NGA_ILE_001]WNW12368.1 DUF4124 domain-containing protein [Pseudomonas sp. DTU_2021_1001937_2_SI_NGA_ILE_001]